jgi:hypothetical protein
MGGPAEIRDGGGGVQLNDFEFSEGYHDIRRANPMGMN